MYFYGHECDPVLHGKYKMHISNFKALEPKEYPKHGVTLHDDLPLQTSIAANLLSFYEVRGGPDAVAEEMNGLKERGWYLSSAGLAARISKRLSPRSTRSTACTRTALSTPSS